MMNPFITSGYHSEKYFCNRVAETEFLVRQLLNGNHIALISPRRLGKTGLIPTKAIERLLHFSD